MTECVAFSINNLVIEQEAPAIIIADLLKENNANNIGNRIIHLITAPVHCILLLIEMK